MKRPLAAACAAALLISMACGVYALSAEDSFISLSYITDIFIPDAVEQGNEKAADTLLKTYDNAAEELEELKQDFMIEATGSINPYSPDFRPREMYSGDILSVETGAGVMLYAGSARVSHNGAFVDVTDGTEIPNGGELVSGHRYLVGEDTFADVVILSGLARVGIEGGYEPDKGEGKRVAYTDVRSDDWYYSAVEYVSNAGLFTGVGDDKFAPHTTMDRAMMMTGFYRLAGSPEREMEEATASFDDVPQSAWYYKFVRWAATQEITAGMGDNKFGPTVQLTREQVVTLLYSFGTRYMGKTMDGRSDVSGYSDYEKASEWAHDALSWAVYYGVLDASWAGENTLGGHQYADRAEVSAMLEAFSKTMARIR